MAFFGTFKCQDTLWRLPTHLLKWDHRIIFCKNEQRRVLQIINIFTVFDDAWKELREIDCHRKLPRFGVVFTKKSVGLDVSGCLVPNSCHNLPLTQQLSAGGARETCTRKQPFDPPIHTLGLVYEANWWFIEFVLLVENGSHYIAHTGQKLPILLQSPKYWITSVYADAWLELLLCKEIFSVWC